MTKTPVGQLIDCAMTGRRSPRRRHPALPDDLPLCRCRPRTPSGSIPGQTLFTVRADPNNHQRIAASISEPDADGDRDRRASVVDHTRPCAARGRRRAGSRSIAHARAVPAHARRATICTRPSCRCSTTAPSCRSSCRCRRRRRRSSAMAPSFPAKRVLIEPNVLTVDWAAAGVPASSGPMLA